VVMINWAWAYLTYERGARLITGSDQLPGWKTVETHLESAPDHGEPEEVSRRSA
jgi:NADH:ubiquinone reductase (H+-translocating)